MKRCHYCSSIWFLGHCPSVLWRHGKHSLSAGQNGTNDLLCYRPVQLFYQQASIKWKASSDNSWLKTWTGVNSLIKVHLSDSKCSNEQKLKSLHHISHFVPTVALGIQKGATTEGLSCVELSPFLRLQMINRLHYNKWSSQKVMCVCVEAPSWGFMNRVGIVLSLFPNDSHS